MLVAGFALALTLPMPLDAQGPTVDAARAPGLTLESALRQTLAQNPNTLIQQQQLIAAEGLQLQARSRFDPVLTASGGRNRDVRPLRRDELDALGFAGIFDTTAQNTAVNQLRAGVDRTTEAGLGLGANVAVTSANDSAQTITGIPVQTSTRVNFTLRVPLARNSGREAVTAELDAATEELNAAALDLANLNAQNLLVATFSYWDLLARQRRVDIARTAERRIADLIEEMQRLIAADQIPRAELELVLASRAERSGQRVAAEQALTEAQRTLARTLGLSGQQMSALPPAVDEFPVLDTKTLPPPGMQEELERRALTLRTDLAALRHREQAARRRLDGARNGLKPAVDLSFSVSWQGLAEGRDWSRFERGFNQSRQGPATGVTLGIEMPWANQLARGALLARAAGFDAATIRIRDLEHGITSNVAVALAGLRRSAEQLRAGIEAVERYAITLRNEQVKRRLGTATTIDVINVEDRLTSALQNEVFLRQGYANAIAQLRFEIGALVRREGDRFDVRVDALLDPRRSLED